MNLCREYTLSRALSANLANDCADIIRTEKRPGPDRRIHLIVSISRRSELSKPTRRSWSQICDLVVKEVLVIECGAEIVLALKEGTLEVIDAKHAILSMQATALGGPKQ